MKLLLCAACYDVRRVNRECVTTCDCGASFAWHTDDLHVEMRGQAQKVYLDNRDIANHLFLKPTIPERLYASFDWRMTPGYKGGTWIREENLLQDGPPPPSVPLARVDLGKVFILGARQACRCNHFATQMRGPRLPSLGRVGNQTPDSRCKWLHFL